MKEIIPMDGGNFDDNFDDKLEELEDEAFRPKVINARQYYASAYILQILQLYTDEDTMLTRKEIMRYLSKDPYAISLERKAFGRIINGLLDSCMGIRKVKGDGNAEKYWFDPDDIYHDIA